MLSCSHKPSLAPQHPSPGAVEAEVMLVEASIEVHVASLTPEDSGLGAAEAEAKLGYFQMHD